MYKKTIKLSKWEEILVGTTVSAVSFPFSLGFIQKFVFKPLRITCKNSFVTVLCGGSSVIISGTIASCGFLSSCLIFQRLRTNSTTNTKHFNVDLPICKAVVLLCGLGSLVVFKFLGGKTRYVVPSHLYYPGAFARVCLPAKGKQYASSSVKQKLNLAGRKYGCHSCGKQRQKYFIADHIPPNKLVKPYQSQVFYPQCKTCSQKQGIALSFGSTLKPIQTHGTTLRKYHLWLPVPLAIAVIKDLF